MNMGAGQSTSLPRVVPPLQTYVKGRGRRSSAPVLDGGCIDRGGGSTEEQCSPKSPLKLNYGFWNKLKQTKSSSEQEAFDQYNYDDDDDRSETTDGVAPPEDDFTLSPSDYAEVRRKRLSIHAYLSAAHDLETKALDYMDAGLAEDSIKSYENAVQCLLLAEELAGTEKALYVLKRLSQQRRISMKRHLSASKTRSTPVKMANCSPERRASMEKAKRELGFKEREPKRPAIPSPRNARASPRASSRRASLGTSQRALEAAADAAKRHGNTQKNVLSKLRRKQSFDLRQGWKDVPLSDMLEGTLGFSSDAVKENPHECAKKNFRRSRRSSAPNIFHGASALAVRRDFSVEPIPKTKAQSELEKAKEKSQALQKRLLERTAEIRSVTLPRRGSLDSFIQDTDTRIRSACVIDGMSCLCDPHRADCPVVGVTPDFLECFKMVKWDILGKNCRVLQGSDTDPETKKLIRAGLEKKKAFTVTIKNYTRYDEPIWIKMTIAPLYSKNMSNVEMFISVQQRLSDVEAKVMNAHSLESVSEIFMHQPHYFSFILISFFRSFF